MRETGKVQEEIGSSRLRNMLPKLIKEGARIDIHYALSLASVEVETKDRLYLCEFVANSRMSAKDILGIPRKTKQEKRQETVTARKVVGKENLDKMLIGLGISREDLGNHTDMRLK